MTTTTKTTAQHFADLLDNDGQQWETANGVNFDDLAEQMDAVKYYAQRDGYNDDGNAIFTETRNQRNHISGDPIRYAFPDGSAIVALDGGWDIEGATPFSWEGA